MRRHRLVASGTLASWLCASTSLAQAPPIAPADATAEPSNSVNAPVVPTRSIVFTPDRQEAQLEFRGIGMVDGIWKEGWIPVCTGRCAGPVPWGEKYRVKGPGIHESRVFEIGPGATPLYLEAKTGSSSAYGLGLAGTIIGGVALPAGLLIFGISHICIGDGGQSCDDNTTQKTVSLVAAGLGAVALVVGVFQLVQGRTVVTGDEPRGAIVAASGPE